MGPYSIADKRRATCHELRQAEWRNQTRLKSATKSCIKESYVRGFKQAMRRCEILDTPHR